MNRYATLRTEVESHVFAITLCRAKEYNTITPGLRDELAAAIDEADADPAARVILLRAEGPAFCAGYGLDWSTTAQAEELLAGSGAETTTYRRAQAGGSAGAESSGGAAPAAAHGDKNRFAAPHGDETQNKESGGAGGNESIGAATAADGDKIKTTRIWDSVADMRMMGRFVDTYMKLWYAKKPTIAAVQGWCIGGGTDMVLCADIIIAGEGASFGYPPSRVWGTPTTAMWVYRMGLEKAKRYLLTGDEIPAAEAARIGLILETVPDERLQEHALAFARRMAQVPTTQLVMLKLLCNQTAENMGLASSRQLGTLFDGIARHTQEGIDFVTRAQQVGFRRAVRERDDPFGDYGSRPKRGTPDGEK